MISSEGADDSVSIVSAIGLPLCFLLLLLTGIISWLRKHVSGDWWRDKCSCFGADGGGSLSRMSGAFSPKPPPSTVADFDAIPTPNATGIDNPTFQRADQGERLAHRLTVQNEVSIEIPRITIGHAPPDYNSLENANQNGLHGFGEEHSSNLRSSLRPRTNTNGSRRGAKVFSKPSITSDYVSDADSEYYLPVTRKATGGRYSSRTFGEKKKHKRKHHYKHAARTGRGREHKYAATSLTNLSKADLRKPITRRHSLATETRQSTRRHVERPRPIPLAKNRPKRSASDVHLLTTAGNLRVQSQNTHVGERPKSASVRIGSSFRLGNTKGTSTQALTVDHALQKASSHNPLPAKSAGLVRSETILELPIYRKSERSASVCANANESIGQKQHQGARPKTRQKPPRSRAARDRKRERRSDNVSRQEKWQLGYGSLPADLGKIQPGVFEKFGMTRESLANSIENLDLEKLCRPVPTITDDQRLATPRKPVVSEHMPNHEKEILKNTYKLEEFGGIVTTDL